MVHGSKTGVVTEKFRMSAIATAQTTATFGALAANARFDQAAQKTTRDITQGGDVVSDFVGQIEARLALQANISVIKTADAMTGKALDIKA